MKVGISVLLALVAIGSECSAEGTGTPCPAFCSCKIIAYFHHVNCSNGGFTELPKNLKENTTNLLFSDNSLKYLKNYTFEKYSKILQLYLDHNQISSIEGATFWNLHELRALFLNHNLLQNIPQDAFINNKQLHWLDLSGNKLLIPESGGLFKSSSVTQLTLAECDINHLPPDMFDKTLNLSKLDLRSNTIESLSLETFKALKHLKSLSLEDNNINCNCDIVAFYDWSVKTDATIGVECSSESMIWNKVSSLNCSGDSLSTWIGVGAGVLLLVALVAVFTYCVRRRRKQSPKMRTRRPPLPSVPAGPTGEYIEVVAEKTYESIRATQVARYMTSPSAPEAASDGPIYVNAFVPPSAPKSRRDRVPTYDDVRSPSLTPSATKTRCMSLASILKDCDYYETVD